MCKSNPVVFWSQYNTIDREFLIKMYTIFNRGHLRLHVYSVFPDVNPASPRPPTSNHEAPYQKVTIGGEYITVRGHPLITNYQMSICLLNGFWFLQINFTWRDSSWKKGNRKWKTDFIIICFYYVIIVVIIIHSYCTHSTL